MILQKDGITYNLTDKIQIAAFLGSGYQVVQKKIVDENTQPVDLSAMTVEQLKAFANENAIELSGAATTKPIITAEIQKALDDRTVV